MIKTIIVGTDGSETATEAVRQAAELAGALGARLHLLSSYQPGMEDAEELRDYEPGEAPNRVLAEAAALAQGLGAETENHVGEVGPVDAIIDLAESVEADLIVVGNKGMRGARRFFLGSVPNAISHNAPCAVMIVRTT